MNSPTVQVFRLYLAGSGPNSVRATQNLRAICEEFLPGCHQIEIIDVLSDGGRALSDNVFLTPSLLRLHPEPECRLVGDLSDRQAVLMVLGLSSASQTET